MSAKDTISTYEQQLEQHGIIIYTNVGCSMMPLLRQNKDVMIIKKRQPGRMKKYDAVLYKRGDKYILHRILKVLPDGYVICGDHNYRREYDIKDSDIIGVLTGVIRDGKERSVTDRRYQVYVHLWCDFFYIRAGILWIKSHILSVGKRIYGKKHVCKIGQRKQDGQKAGHTSKQDEDKKDGRERNR